MSLSSCQSCTYWRCRHIGEVQVGSGKKGIRGRENLVIGKEGRKGGRVEGNADRRLKAKRHG
jgi:hypothetical protein